MPLRLLVAAVVASLLASFFTRLAWCGPKRLAHAGFAVMTWSFVFICVAATFATEGVLLQLFAAIFVAGVLAGLSLAFVGERLESHRQRHQVRHQEPPPDENEDPRWKEAIREPQDPYRKSDG